MIGLPFPFATGSGSPSSLQDTSNSFSSLLSRRAHSGVRRQLSWAATRGQRTACEAGLSAPLTAVNFIWCRQWFLSSQSLITLVLAWRDRLEARTAQHVAGEDNEQTWRTCTG